MLANVLTLHVDWGREEKLPELVREAQRQEFLCIVSEHIYFTFLMKKNIDRFITCTDVDNICMYSKISRTLKLSNSFKNTLHSE